MNKIGLVFILIGFFIPLHAQLDKVDSLKIENLIEDLFSRPVSDETMEFAKHIEDLSQQIKYSTGAVKVKNWLGNTYFLNGKYEQALDLLQQAIVIGTRLDDTNLLAESNLFLGNTYKGLRDFEKAKSYYKKSLGLFKKADNQLKINFGLISLGVIHLETGEPAKALEYLLPAKDSLEKHSTRKYINKCTNNIAIAYVQLNKPQQAIPYFEEQLEYFKSEKDTFNFAASYGNLAYAYQNLQDFEQAFIYYDSSLYYSNLLNQDEVTYITLLDMSDGYTLKGDLKNALQYHKKYHQLYQKVLNNKTKSRIAELEVEFETEKKEKEIIALEQQAAINRQNMYLMIGGFIASLIIAFLIYVKWRSDIKKKEAQAALTQIELKNKDLAANVLETELKNKDLAANVLETELKNKDLAASVLKSELKNKQLEANHLQSQLDNKKADLTNLALDISRKNEFSKQLIQRLEQLQKVKPNNIKTELRGLIQFTDNHLHINDDLALLQNNVQQINQEFYQNLDARFDKLSANEKYLAGLIRLKLSNKDIAAIRGISVSSAKMNRYRLRKKLSLQPEEDIVVFLQGI